MKAIGDRMKQNYEGRCKHLLIRRMPVIVRVDGKAFHTFTKRTKCRRPFDQHLINSMIAGAKAVASQMQGFKAAYIQSDEASFLMTDYDTFATCAWFDNEQNKIESITASLMTAGFNRYFNQVDSHIDAHFDSRAFNVPREDVVNYFLWRALDWERNSVSMYCNSLYSHQQMHGKGRADQHEMLFKAGKNWATDLTPQHRNGTWLYYRDHSLVEDHSLLPSYTSIGPLIDPLICEKE